MKKLQTTFKFQFQITNVVPINTLLKVFNYFLFFIHFVFLLTFKGKKIMAVRA